MRGTRIIASLALVYSFAAPRLTAQVPAPVDPCSLLTAAEVSAIVGIKSLPGHPYLGSKVVCLFAADTGVVIGAAAVNVMVLTPAMYQNQKNMGGALAPKPVSGIGDEAYRVGSGGYVKLEVLKGGHAFSVTIAEGTELKATADQLAKMEEALAQKAVGRI
ncbi:MAG: hypothetical protein ACREND_17200 [Gemmatimonadaceae bacterium]